MKTPAAVLEDLMEQVRAHLYSALPDRAWFTQQELVKRALTLPAKWLDERKVEIPAERYQKIVQGILDTIKTKGRPARLLGPFPYAYLWQCVESHMRLHGDEYYEEGKGIRNRVKLFMSQVERAQAGADSTVPVLARVHLAVAVGRRKSKGKASATTVQPDFFGTADDVHFAKVREENGAGAPNWEKSSCRQIRRRAAS